MSILEATPKTVILPALPSSVSSGPTTITWNTSTPATPGPPGRVWRQIDGGLVEAFDPIVGAKAKPFGSQATTIGLGHTYRFFLYSETGPPPGVLLQTLTVSAYRLTMPSTPMSKGYPTLLLVQGITRVKVTPGADFADFSFRTNRTTLPLIFVGTAPPKPNGAFAPGDQVAMGGPGSWGVNHAARVGGQGQLAAKTRHWFVIFAASDLKGDGPVFVTGSFMTGLRRATVVFDTIYVIRDADPGLKGAGEIRWDFGVYGPYLLWSGIYPFGGDFDDFNDGDTVPIGSQAVIEDPPPPDVLTIEVFGDEDDDWEPGAGVDLRSDIEGPSHFPDTSQFPSPAGWNEDSWGAWASAQESYTLQWGPSGVPVSQSFSLATSPAAGLCYTLNGHIDLYRELPGTYRFGNDWITTPDLQSAVVMVAGGPSRGPGPAPSPPGGPKEPRESQQFMLGADGGVYHRTLEPRRPRAPRPAPQWQQIGHGITQPVTAVSTLDEGGERVHLFAIGRDGNVLHKTHADGRWSTPPGEWKTLGGGVTGPIAAVSLSGGRVEIFGLSARGTVLGKMWTGSAWEPAGDTWQTLGGRIAGELQVVPSDGEQFDLIGRAPDGSVQRKAWTGRAWEPAARDWERVGSGTEGPLVGMRSPKGQLQVLVYGPGSSLFRKTLDGRRWSPPRVDRWERLDRNLDFG